MSTSASTRARKAWNLQLDRSKPVYYISTTFIYLLMFESTYTCRYFNRFLIEKYLKKIKIKKFIYGL
jgi:hypothetical protein